MSTPSPWLLRRIALISLIVGLGLLVVIEVVFVAATRQTVTNDSLFILLIGIVVEWLGCAAVVFAGNALTWSFIVPRLPGPGSKRSIVVGITTLAFSLLSVAAVFFLLLYIPQG
ncbi:MAG TPA: hypothetical protein VN108_10025 [Marmoricola sp.]|nr:hypothetical protein [Marmoricola sp.]